MEVAHGHRRDVHDGAPAAGLHHRNDLAAEPNRRHEHALEVVLPAVVVLVEDARRAHERSDRVHERVDSPESVARRSDDARWRVGGGEVLGPPRDLDAQLRALGSSRRESFRRLGGQGEPRTLAREHERGRPPHPRARTGHQRHAAGQAEVHCDPSPGRGPLGRARPTLESDFPIR